MSSHASLAVLCAAALVTTVPATTHAQLGPLARAAVAATRVATARAAQAAATVSGDGDGASRTADARMAQHQRFQACVQANLPALGTAVVDTPELERNAAELQQVQAQVMAAGMANDEKRLLTLQDTMLSLVEQQMVLQYPALARRCGPAPTPAAR
jgi:hypothetical protein